MASTPKRPQRRSIRLPEYDYSQPGAYFVTLVVSQRRPLFGKVEAGEMILNDLGRLVADAWSALPATFNHCEVDEWIVMPDHFHGILWLHDLCPAGEAAGRVLAFQSEQDFPAASPLHLHLSGPAAGSLGAVIRHFKSITRCRINVTRRKPGTPVWLRNYFERIVRNQDELDRAREYILNNPLQWQIDRTEDPNWWHPTIT